MRMTWRARFSLFIYPSIRESRTGPYLIDETITKEEEKAKQYNSQRL